MVLRWQNRRGCGSSGKYGRQRGKEARGLMVEKNYGSNKSTVVQASHDDDCRRR